MILARALNARSAHARTFRETPPSWRADARAWGETETEQTNKQKTPENAMEKHVIIIRGRAG